MMKAIRVILGFGLALVFLLSSDSLSAIAMDTKFITEEMSQEDINSFLNRNQFTLLTEEPPRNGIRFFDVSEKHMVATACLYSGKGYICIYQNGNFLYGYRFNANKPFMVEWAGANLNVLFTYTLVTLSPEGEIIDLATVSRLSQNNKYQRTLQRNKRVVGDMTYTLHKTFLASSYSKLVVTDENGSETVWYDVSGDSQARVLFCLVAGVLFFAIIFFIVFRGLFAYKNKTNR